MGIDKVAVERLWRLYRETRLDGVSNALSERYRHLAKLYAEKMRRGFPAKVSVEDLYQEAMMGLMSCFERFDERRANFTTYVTKRIRGAILDYLRRADWVPRQVRHRAQVIKEVRSRFLQKHGREATDEECRVLAKAGKKEWRRWKKETEDVHQVLSLDAMLKDKESGHQRYDKLNIVAENVEDWYPRYDIEQIRGLVAGLEERQKFVVQCYYFQQLSMKRIGQALGLSESRVCQIHKEAIVILREKALGKMVRRDAPYKRGSR